MLADHSVHEISGRLSTAAFRQAQPQMARLVGAAFHLGDQRTPFIGRAAVLLPVRARPFPPMVEELHILRLERLDLGLYEGVEFRELVDNVMR
jgi:hypothetical protein